ncbi:6-bladed beta-propeller [uncultured Bacteroides sp.]|uniref:6-bladed beta-propeller n=1 Tax=uncultured Bacteroides sp. TaxID=162156 RepID=UPI0025F979BD|nr:6-bladed beta-propeller [uncultured Bacteroides sp.]
MINKKVILELIKHKGYIIVAIFLFLSIGCQAPKSKVTTREQMVSDSTLIQIDVDPTGKDTYAFDSLIDDISYIRLETNDSCLIGNIHQLLVTNEYIFVLDAFVTNAVYCFDKQGHFIRQIGVMGEGAGEYLRLCKIALTSDRKQIVLYDWNRLHYYDLKGNYIKDITPNIYANDIKLMNDDLVVAFRDAGLGDDSQHRMLAVYDKDFKLIYREFPTFYNESFHLNNDVNPLRSFGNGVYLREPWTHSIYKIDKDRCREKYRININNGGYPERLENMREDAYMRIVGTKIHMMDYILLKDYALFYFTQNGLNWSPFVIYSHKTQRTYRCNGISSNPLFFAHSPHNVSIACYDGESFLVPQPAIEVIRMKETVYNSPLINDSKLLKLYDGLTEDSNPVLFLLHIKSI